MTDTPPDPGTREPPSRRLLLVVLAVGIALDQVTKTAAHAPVVNQAGTSYLLPTSVRQLWAHPHVGAVLDLLDVAPLVVLVTLALRAVDPRLHPGGGLLSAGWASNWLDRVGLSALTQPGSPRGAVDWVR